jgi:hypothetical protein
MDCQRPAISEIRYEPDMEIVRISEAGDER